MRPLIEKNDFLQLRKPSPQADLREGEYYGALETEQGGWVRVSGAQGKSILCQASLFVVIEKRGGAEAEGESVEELAIKQAKEAGIL